MEIVQEEESDIIRTYLKVGNPKKEEKHYYDLDLDKNIILLHDPVFKIKSDNSSIIEVNKIFTSAHNYSYIYEQICQNTISESLSGDSFVFISYGITSSEKLEMLIGNIEDSNRNKEHIGIMPRLLNKLIDNINNNKEYKDNISINLSYICVHNTKLIDLSNYIGKDFSKYTANDFLKDGLLIENTDIINQVKKVPTENYNDVLFFINKLLLYLRKLEDNSNGYLFSKSHFAIIIYITNNDGKTISKLTFILLNGSEQLNKDKQRRMSTDHINKNIVELSKMALDSQYTYNSIIYAIKNNESICGRKILLDDNIKGDINLLEQKNLSRLTKVLFYPCFNRKNKNIKFIILGSIMPIPGLYDSVKDTLLFLFEFRKILSKKKRQKKKHTQKKSEISNNKLDISQESKDDLIFGLEEKIKLQERKISDLNKIIEHNMHNINALEKSYKKQVNILKDYLGFKGDINILLSGYEYSEEMRNAKEIRESRNNVKRLKVKISELEEKLKKANEEIIRYNNIKEIKEENNTMINYYLSARRIEEQKINKDNRLNIEINKCQKQLKIKDKIIQGLQNDLDEKNNIFQSMPKFLKELENHIIEEKEKEKEKEREKEKNDELSSNNNDHNTNKIKNLKLINHKEYLFSLKDKDKEIKELKKRYENILAQKEKMIFDLNNELNSIKYQNLEKFQKYEDELLKINELFTNLINNYKRIFLSNFTEKCNAVTINNKKIQFDHILSSIKKEYDTFSFPLLFSIIEKKGILIKNNLNSFSLRRASKDRQIKLENQKLKLSNNNSLLSDNDNIILLNRNEKEERKEENSPLNTINEFFTNLNNEINMNNIMLKIDDIKSMPKDDIINEYQKMINLILKFEVFMKKLEKKNNENQRKKNINIINYKNELNNYKNKIEQISNSLDKEKSTNNKNLIIINSQNRIIEKLQQDLLFKEIPEYKMKLSRKINKKINLSLNKDKDYLKYINNNNSYYRSEKKLKINRVFSSKNKEGKMHTESSYIKSAVQPTNISTTFNNTFMKFNTPIKIPTEENTSRF